MFIEMARVGKVFGDRILVRRLERPEKIGRILVPANYAKDRPTEQELWWGVIEAFGLDSTYSEAYGLAVGDIVGLDSLATNNAAFDGDDGNVHAWVMQEFVVCKDLGLVAAYRDGKDFPLGPGLLPLGPYSLIEPHKEEETRNGIALPQNVKQTTRTGKVIAVSLGEVRAGSVSALRVAVGSEVIIGKYSGSWAKFGELKFVLVKEEDTIAELTPAKELAHVS